MLWWFQTKISATHNALGGHNSRGGAHNSSCSSQHAASSLCDEIVTLWRLAALNPSLSPIQRDDLETQLKDWHIKTIDKVRKMRGATGGGGANPLGGAAAAATANSGVKKNDIEMFSGFKAAIESCQLDWADYELPGITYVDKYPPHWRFSFGRAAQLQELASGGGDARAAKHGGAAGGSGGGGGARPRTSQVSGYAMKSSDGPLGHLYHLKTQEYSQRDCVLTDGSSSEGFCDADRRNSKDRLHDSDSDLGVDIGDMSNHASSSHVTTTTTRSSSSGNGASNSHHTRKLSNTNDVTSSAVGSAGASSSAGSTVVSKPNASGGLQVPAHVKVMKSDDMTLDEQLAVATNKSSDGLDDSQGEAAAAAAALVGGAMSGAANVDTAPAAAAGGAISTAENDNAVAAARLASGADAQQQQPQLPGANNDEYSMYFYDTRASANDLKSDKDSKKKKEEPNYFAGLKKLDNSQDVSCLFVHNLSCSTFLPHCLQQLNISKECSTAVLTASDCDLI